MEIIRIGRKKRPRKLAGDKGYSYGTIRRWLRRYRIGAVIPPKSNQKIRPGRPAEFDPETYLRRNVIERSVGWFREMRALCTRFEKLAVNYLAFFKLAMIERYLKMDSSDTA